ncbi:BTAD domain-containing putative transcriptional regulator [Amycolatopsis sp. 195334CR]|uniref:BTAD domain-containing putative transcriptional regulator n=1 Tax=Amycolatopsis sp. 195334CR TaxID=2814588 RepID=UPI001A8D73C3|nr:BTAD domain-containing putative transcriptional regulator [Amycolatopsis sp. 195334CR]MBN6042086.1 winged helix-turn-helix domain-containing protein [Amycolatopsis sp. 195334CR]
MRVVLLGPVRAGDAPVSARLRMLLARLALTPGAVVSTDALIDGLWGADPPAEAVNALHALVYRLRKALRETVAVESAGTGYRLAVEARDVDASRFEELAARGRRELADSPQQAAETLREALALWRGDALADVRGAPFAEAAATRLAELRLAALEDRFEAELRLGHHGEVLADLTATAAAHPLRERLAALRMRALAAAGRQSDALAAYEEVRGTLADELGMDPSEAVRDAHLAVLRGEPATRPAPGRLPAPLTSFVGRETEVKLVEELLGTARLVTIAGPGGVGKTRLATEVAARHHTHRQGRLWLVPLAGVDDPAGAVLGALSTSTGRPAGGTADPVARVAELLGGGEAVLVLDNCEQVIEAVAELAGRLLERQPQLRVLVTSREPLEVLGEALCRLGPLALPHRRDDAAGSPAVRLFLDRAAAVRPGFALDESTVDAVVEVVRRLDGLPLALELAAARLRSMSAGQIARRLDDRFRLLSTGNRAAQPRQRTLHAVIEWSWELLTAPERTLARRLAVFPTGAGANAVESVCADERLPAEDVAYLLGSLVDKSIVDVSGDRYRMLESIRAHLGEKLDDAERTAVQHRFTRYFAGLADRNEPLLRSAAQREALALFETEYDNLLLALRSAIDNRDAGSAVLLLAPLCWYWNTLRFDGRADGLMEGVLGLGDALPEDARAAFTGYHLFTGAGPMPQDAEKVRELAEECVRTGAMRRYPMLMMATLTAAYLLGQGELVEREIDAVRAGTDRWARACTYLVETFLRYDRGDWAGVIAATDEALRAFEETGDRVFTAMALSGVAHVRSIGGDHAAALAAYRRAADLAPPGDLSYRIGLATERMRAGDLDGARQDLATAQRLAADSGQHLLEVVTAIGLADLHRRAGDPARSDRELDRLLAVAREAPLPDHAAKDAVAAARMENRLTAGDAVGARALLPATIATATAHHDLASAAQHVARLRFLEGDHAGAATALGLSEAIRGTFDRGDAELRDLVTALTGLLGAEAYETAYLRGAALPREDAATHLLT